VIRKRLDLSMLTVAERLEWSESTVSRLENGRRNIDPEDVSALLAIYGVTGRDRDRLMAMARTPDEPSWLDNSMPGVPVTSVKLAEYETDAIRVTDWAPLLVPGLLQTMEYTRAFMLGDEIPDSAVGSRLMARQRRQEQILSRAQFVAYIDEFVLHRRIGGPRVFARQLRHLIEMANEDAVTLRIVPGTTDRHPGLAGPFLLLEYPTATPIVHVELRRSGVFLTGREDTDPYLAAVTQLASISLDQGQSLQLLSEVAGEIEGKT
jgi:transcriptional regulator with XRE-family HTH domain